MVLSDSVFAGSRSLTSQVVTSRCQTQINPSGWSSTARSTTFLNSSANWKCYGHVFRTTCDTEVIVNGYKQWGDGVFDRLNGMFGLAIWDVRRKRLLLVRDPFGIKLVYYRIEDGHGLLRIGDPRRPRRAGPVGRTSIRPH